MLKIKLVPILTRIVSKLDTQPIIDALKNADIFAESNSKEDAAKQLESKKTEIGLILISVVAPQLGNIGEEIPEFVSLYKGCSLDEAGEYDIAEIINELYTDEGIVNFFKNALRKKVEQTH